ncbi:spore gernimation protein [Peribacillus cavernae]|uniref:Spore gernimation protein n=1 Tax=Peribacillus cavernae TaxID=1674310 RepID=A0A3S0VF97_9BACI|nr:GerAB/ArcD/ProY family transporter [Peribacillus cavernae]MDQ0218773.1 spore germination protein (amino acid permease) [Peribacillus cavernae]RUQ30984.1 spore gernimation protein [Peribacillus cavernae]
MKTIINEEFLVSPFFVFFLMYTSIIGVGIMSFQRDITEGAGYDAWISVLLSGVSIHILVWMMYRILGLANNDVTYIHQFCFGKWIGGLLNAVIIIYFLLMVLITFRVYIEIVQVSMFPLMKTWQISFIFLLLIYYVVSGGFRVITGICFWGTVLPFMILFPLSFFPLEFAHINHLFPLFSHSVKEILVSTKTMVYQFIGFSTLFMFYPFIKNPERSQKWAHFGVLTTILLYFIIAIITFVYFSEEHLKHTILPTLTLGKIVEVPMIERFEYIIVSMWLLLVLPNICLKLWAACRGVKKLINIKQHTILFIFLFILFCLTNVLERHRQIEQLANVISNIGFYFSYLYIPFLFVAIHIKQKFNKSKVTSVKN